MLRICSYVILFAMGFRFMRAIEKKVEIYRRKFIFRYYIVNEMTRTVSEDKIVTE